MLLPEVPTPLTCLPRMFSASDSIFSNLSSILIFLSYSTFTVLPAVSTLHETQAFSNSKLQLQNPWLSHFLTLWPPHPEESPPRHQALYYSLFLQKQTQDISLLTIFQLSNIVHHLYQSVQCVCVCVCVCVCIFCINVLFCMAFRAFKDLPTLCGSFFFFLIDIFYC